MGAQLVGQAERKIQEAAVDRADLQTEPAVAARRSTIFCGRAVLGTGVSGHAVNWHWTFDGCLQLPDYPGFASSLRLTGEKCLPRSSRRHCRQAARSAAIGWCAGLLPARSEEHTSELQSPCNLVCRLLLEKKKKKE